MDGGITGSTKAGAHDEGAGNRALRLFGRPVGQGA